MVQEPTRTCHYYFYAPLKLFYLGIDPDSAIDGNALQAGLLSQITDGNMDLLRQFSGRGYDKGPDVAMAPLHQSVKYWQGKSCGLPCSCLRQAHDVASLHDRRDRLGLDRSRRCVPSCNYPCCHFFIEIKFFKFHKLPLFLCSKRKKPRSYSGAYVCLRLFPGTANFSI